MRLEIDIAVAPQDIKDEQLCLDQVREKLKNKHQKITSIQLLKRSIDARQKKVLYRLRYEVWTDEIPDEEPDVLSAYKPVSSTHSVIIVGAGPAGYFAALKCIELGLKPIVLERGKDVRQRRRDLRAIQQEGIVNPDSNYCYGEGGAGTYSDGKLYTRSHKRGKIIDILRLLVRHGAHRDILIDAHPHIGSNKLPNIVQNIRSTIEAYGGEVHFDTKVVEFLYTQKNVIVGVNTDSNQEFRASTVILATGHSARDIFALCEKDGVTVDSKPFALGLRIEHPQALIDSIQYRQPIREENLPASSYSMVHQTDGGGVFSFCMCPGGLMVPAATAPGEIVVNGMSLSKRDSLFANSGVVVAISEIPEDLRTGRKQLYEFLDLQRQVEQKAFALGDGSQKAPAQRVVDFVEGKVSTDLPKCSYIPGLYSTNLDNILPPFVSQALKEGILAFGQKMKGYYTNEACLVGVESRTSSPIRIERDPITKMSPSTIGLFPCGEGAGYAGGILSAAMDGQAVAIAVAEYLGIN